MVKKITEAEQADVDTRFLLANERTLLAWIRTSLAIEAGGIALIGFHSERRILGFSIILLGAAVAVIGYHRFRMADKAIRQHHLPPSGTSSALQLMGVVFIAVAIAIVQLTI
jgi:putative membrane protein